MKKGLILVNAYASTVHTRQVQRMREAFFNRGVHIDVMRNDAFSARIENGNAVFDGDYDFCLFLDKDKYASHIIEKHVRLFNSAAAIELCDDKMTTHIALADHGIPMPDTLPGLLCYDSCAEVSDAALKAVADRLGLPVIVKQSFGSMGTGVHKADSFAELRALTEKFKTEPILYQRYIEKSRGKDMRVIVVGKKVLGGIIRQAKDDFRSNIGLGGSATATAVPSAVAEIAVRAAEILELDYCGIDFLLGDAPLLCEVNSNAFFDAFESATGIDVAGAYADHILSEIGRGVRA